MGFESGLGVVLLALILYRLSESFGLRKEEWLARRRKGHGQEA